MFYEESFVNPIKDILPEVLPGFYPEANSSSVFVHLYQGAVCELRDVEAVPMLENNTIKYWYPQYQATVVIAVDREQTDAVIHGWNSLLYLTEPVGFMSYGLADAELLSAASAGITDENFEKGQYYISKAAVNFFSKLRRENRFAYNDFSAPVLICFDFQAVALKKQGRNIEIVIPVEGTRSYINGFASNEELSFLKNSPEAFISAGFRLTDGRADQAFYPSNEEYQRAFSITDYDRYGIDASKADKILDRKIRYTRLYSSADGWEHQIFAAIFLVILLFWSGVFVRRILQPKLRKLLLATSAMMGGWILIRYVKYLLLEIDWKIRYSWYAFYIFMLGIPILILWFMLETDGKEEFRVPILVRKVVLTIYLCLLAIVFTNDFHMLVFKMDLSNKQWSNTYQYGPVYWIIVIWIFVMLGLSVLLLVIKSGKVLQGKGRIIPVLFLCLFIGYGAGYNMGIPFIRDSDFTMTAGIFYMLLFETAMQSGLIMINREYGRIFVHSSLKMQIYDKNKTVWLASGESGKESDNINDILYFEEQISGGSVVWQEDISEVMSLQKQIQDNVIFIRRSNELLAREQELKAKKLWTEQKLQILTLLEEEIHDKMIKLSALIEELPKNKNEQRAIGKITLMLCYIKRRCNLFFRERGQEQLPAEDLKFYLDEITEFAEYAGVKYLVQCNVTCNIRPRMATLFYDLVHEVLMACCDRMGATILVTLQMEEDKIVLRLLPSMHLEKDILDPILIERVAEAKGKIIFKELGETAGISLIFADGGYERVEFL